MSTRTSREEQRRRLLPAILLIWSAALGVGCGLGATRAERVPLAHTFASPDAAAAAVVDNLAAGNLEGLRELALSEHEFRTVVWPELPSSRPEAGLPLAYAWGTLHQNSLASLSSTFAAHRGRAYSVVGVEFAGDTTHYQTVTVHRRAIVVVRDADGRERRLALFGSLLARDGRYKLFSYVTD